MMGNASVAGKLCIGNTCLSERSLNLLFPSIIAVYPTYSFDDVLKWGSTIVDDVYPILLWNGYIDKRDNGIGYLCRSGHTRTDIQHYEIYYMGSTQSNPVFDTTKWAGPVKRNGFVSNLVDRIIIYPGYGIQIWNRKGSTATYTNSSSVPTMTDLTQISDFNATNISNQYDTSMVIFTSFKLQ
jgi:hypothetical protein